jgi:Domain of unknown function (DUF4411)
VIYSIDTSSLVGAWRRSYPPSLLPRLWDKDLPALIASGDLRASQEVRIELERQDDEVLAWALEQQDLFVEVDGQVESGVKAILARTRISSTPTLGARELIPSSLR